MKRMFLIVLLLCLFVGVVGAQEETKNYTFQTQANALDKEVFPKIREYVKTVKLYPYTDEIGQEVVMEVEKIIVTNENLFIATTPTVDLIAYPGGGKIHFQLKLLIAVYDAEKFPYAKTRIVFGKYIFIKTYTPKPKDGKKYSL